VCAAAPWPSSQEHTYADVVLFAYTVPMGMTYFLFASSENEDMHLVTMTPHAPMASCAYHEHVTQPDLPFFCSSCENLFEKLIVSQLVNKSPAFYGTRRFITVFTEPLILMKPVHTFSKLHSRVIFASTTRSSELSLPFGFSDEHFCMPLSSL